MRERKNLQGVDEALTTFHGDFIKSHGGGVMKRRRWALQLHC